MWSAGPPAPSVLLPPEPPLWRRMTAMRARPVSWPVLVDLVVDRVLALPADAPVPVAVDGADAARPGDLADLLVDGLREAGRAPVRVPAAGFLRAASLRLERGRTDAEAYYELWLDDGALAREVLDPAGPGGTGRVLPSLRDPATDRATRAPYLELPPAAVVLVDGPLLLGRWLPFDLTVQPRDERPGAGPSYGPRPAVDAAGLRALRRGGRAPGHGGRGRPRRGPSAPRAGGGGDGVVRHRRRG